jgi:Tfp pilus assembly protein PilX
MKMLPRKTAMKRSRNRQQGVVLLIALTVLVAMSLAGVALMRSVDNTVVVAGNLAFKTASVQVADYGSQQAITWLQANSAGTGLHNTNLGRGYYSARPPDEPVWYDVNTWQDAFSLNGGVADASGNVIRYVIHRMCTNADVAPDETCSMYFPKSTVTEGGSKATGAPAYDGIPQVYYRVTTRVEGPRNNVTVVQTSVLIAQN